METEKTINLTNEGEVWTLSTKPVRQLSPQWCRAVVVYTDLPILRAERMCLVSEKLR